MSKESIELIEKSICWGCGKCCGCHQKFSGVIYYMSCLEAKCKDTIKIFRKHPELKKLVLSLDVLRSKAQLMDNKMYIKGVKADSSQRTPLLASLEGYCIFSSEKNGKRFCMIAAIYGQSAKPHVCQEYLCNNARGAK